jgi:hypothetical protein
MPNDPTYLGLTATNWILVTATLTGPIIAVIITIVTERLRSRRQSRLNIIQTILNHRQTPANDQYQWAIMAVAIEYRNDKEVMAAHLAYMRHVGLQVTPEMAAVHDRQTGEKLSTLMKLLFARVGSKISEADIDSLSYYTVGAGKRDEIIVNALIAIVRVANTLEEQLKLLQKQEG